MFGHAEDIAYFAVSSGFGFAVLKGTAAVGLALLAVTLLRRVAPHWRHAVLMAGLVVQSVLLAQPLVAPAWQLRVLPDFSAGTEGAVGAVPLSVGAARGGTDWVAPVASGASMAPAHAWTLTRALFWFWLGGALILLLRTCLGLFTVLRLVRRARASERRPSDGRLQELARGCASSLGLDTSASVLICDEVEIPATFGLLRPVVLLPAKAREWSGGRLRAVLLHELAHVANRDVLNQLVTSLSRSLHWLNPLTRLACSATEAERERMADQAAVRAGVPRGEYVTHVIEVLREARPLQGRQAVAQLGGRAYLDRRLRHLLAWEPGRHRPARTGPAAGLAVALVALPLGALAPRLPGGEAPRQLANDALASGCDYAGGRHLNLSRMVDGRRRWHVEWAGRGCSVRWDIIGAVTLQVESGVVSLPHPADSVMVTVRGPRPMDLAVFRRGEAVGYQASGPGAAGLGDGRGHLRAQAFAPWVLELDQHTAFALDQRFEGLANAGLDSLMVEVAKMQGDHAATLYLTAAARRMSLNPAQVATVLKATLRYPTNDWALQQLLTSIAGRYPLDDEGVRDAYRAVADRIGAESAREEVDRALAAGRVRRPPSASSTGSRVRGP